MPRIWMRYRDTDKGGQLPFLFFDALAMSDEEAAAVQMDVNVERVMEETRRQWRR